MKLLTVQEAAETLRVTPQWVYKMARRGVLPTVRLGRQLRIDAAVLEGWLAEHSSNGNGHLTPPPAQGNGTRDGLQ